MSKIRQSARGEQCQIRIPYICNHDSSTVVWAHANGSAAGKGIGMKSHDILGAYACSACHDAYNKRSGDQFTPYTQLDFWEGHARSLLILIKKGLVKV